MADFTSDFWNWFIVVGTVIGVLSMFVLIIWLGGDRPGKDEEITTMGHVWDGDLAELNNPLPKWWLNLFYITLFFSIGYLVAYPGLGTFQGLLGWSSTGQYEAEQQTAKERYGPLYDKFVSQDMKMVAADPVANKIGQRLFLNYCSSCHGSDAGGARGFPSLRDDDWLYGGDPETIKTSIMHGRNGVMPPWEQALGGADGVKAVTDYVLSLSRGGEAPAAGKEKFQQMCSACHGMDGKGNPLLGAPNLTDAIWLHGGSPKRVMESIAKGRKGQMPAHSEFLGEAKVHILAAYIWGLSN